MVKVIIERDVNNNIVSYNAKGHSDYAERGQDIVCAAVSTLLQTTLLGLTKLANTKLTFKIADGNMKVQLTQNPNHDSNLILECMQLGLIEIENAYRDCVQITERRR